MTKLYSYTSTAGYNAMVPAKLHKMIQRGISVRSVNGGLLTKQCKFTLDDGTKVVAIKTDKTVTVQKVTQAKKTAKVAKKQAVAKPKGAPSNADLIRGKIAIVKATGGTIDDVIAYGINELGQSKTQAKTYATNNWNKA